MKRRRISLIVAIALSLALHAAVVVQVVGMTITVDTAGTLFAAPDSAKPKPTRITRSVRDLIVDDSHSVDPIETGPDAAKIHDDSEKLIDDVDPTKLLPPEPKPIDTAKLAGPKDVDPTPPAPRSDDPKADPAKPLNLTDKLLAMANPSLKLPEYKGPTDGVVTVDPKDAPVDPTARIDLDNLGLNNIGGSPLGIPGGTGSGPGGTGTPGTGGGPIAPPPIATIDPTTTTTPTLPDIPLPTLPIPPLGSEGSGPAKPTIHLDQDFEYQLFTYWPPPPKEGFFEQIGIADKKQGEQQGYFEVRITPRRSLKRLEPLNKNLVFVIDTSDSITQRWVSGVKRGVDTALDALGPKDNFNIVLFKDTVSVLSPEGPVPATDANRKKAASFLGAAEASGYTDVNRALAKLMVRAMPADRVYQIVLISDGLPTRGALDPRKIMNLITRENDLVGSIFCVGVGDKQNRTLLEFLAYRNKGFAIYPDNVLSAPASIRELIGRLRYPVLKDVAYDVIGVEADRMYPRAPRDVYQGEPFSVFGRYDKDTKRISVRLAGANGKQPVDFTVTLPFEGALRGTADTRKDWAFWKLHHLYAEILRHGKTPELQKQIDDVRKKYDLKTVY